MTRAQIESEMVQLQNLMEGLATKEMDAHKRKVAAEIEIAAIHNYWLTLYGQYQDLRSKLLKLK